MNDVLPAATGTQIAEFTRYDQALSLLDDRLKGIVYDFTKPGELPRAIKDRAEVRGYRTDLERTRKDVKEDALAQCRKIDGEAKRIEERLRDVESPIDEQIKAEEGRKERERAAREEAERSRIAGIQESILGISGLALRVSGQPAADVLNVIDELERVEITAETFAEFQDQARGAKEKALTMLRQLHAGAVAQEATAQAEARRQQEEAERNERERAELDRRRAEQDERDRLERERQAAIAAEDAARRAKIAEEDAWARERRDREEAEHRANLKAAEEEAAAKRREAERVQAEEDSRIAAERQRMEAERRAFEQQQQELMDARTILSRFVERFGEMNEFKPVAAAIKTYFAKRVATKVVK